MPLAGGHLYIRESNLRKEVTLFGADIKEFPAKNWTKKPLNICPESGRECVGFKPAPV